LAGGRRGFHACVITVFGGTVASAKLLGLNAEQTGNAIALAATSIGGLGMSTNSLAREYHAGASALAAVNAARAAGRGFTANDDMLEAPGGFLATFGAKVEPASLM